MFPDINCDFEEADFHQRSMWFPFFEQRRLESTPDESDEETDNAPEPKKGKSFPVKGLKEMSIDSDDDSPVRPPSPAATQAAIVGEDSYYHRRSTLHVADVRQSLGRKCDGHYLLGMFSATATPSPG
jgi:hypothetical protein